MTILSDKEILERCEKEALIVPFFTVSYKEQFGEKCVSYGVSSYGYDIRLADEFQLQPDEDIDPKNAGYGAKLQANEFFIDPHSVLLCRSVEYFNIPKDIMCFGFGKSTYARCGIIVNITPIEPGWSGFLTISISNTSSERVKLYAFEGIAQLVFHKVDNVCEVSYSDRDGKYMNQQQIQGAIV